MNTTSKMSFITINEDQCQPTVFEFGYPHFLSFDRLVIIMHHENYKRNGEKVPIETIPVELRIKIYELGVDIGDIFPVRYEVPWVGTIFMSGLLNDKDAIEIAAIQRSNPRRRPGRIMCELIAISGNLPMMKWARSESPSTKHDATSMDRLPLFPWDAWTCSNAARFGNIEMLKWLHQKKCPWHPWDSSILTYVAAENGHLESLKWLHEIGIPWNEKTCAAAATGGHIDILMWLREHDCPWDGNTLKCAKASGFDDVYSWAIQNDCPHLLP
jgi:hypothetical protein